MFRPDKLRTMRGAWSPLDWHRAFAQHVDVAIVAAEFDNSAGPDGLSITAPSTSVAHFGFWGFGEVLTVDGEMIGYAHGASMDPVDEDIVDKMIAYLYETR